MASAFKSFTFTNLHIPSSSSYSISGPNHGCWLSMKKNEKREKNLMRGSLCVRKALPHDLPLMAVMVQQIEGMRDIITEKHVWHLSDKAIKNVYLFYIMFTCWGCLYFGSAKDPFYDSEEYRGDGGDGTGYWVYETVRSLHYGDGFRCHNLKHLRTLCLLYISRTLLHTNGMKKIGVDLGTIFSTESCTLNLSRRFGTGWANLGHRLLVHHNLVTHNYSKIGKGCYCALASMMQQEDIEEKARAELWREELIEEIELKVGGLRELEEAVNK